MPKTLHTTNYYNTFIEASPDCPVQKAEAPPAREQKTAAQIEYDMLARNPYKYTSDDVLYAAHGKSKHVSRSGFFSTGQPCMRSSPLTKRYGWGVHSNAEGKVAIFPLESAEYKKLATDKKLKHLQGMRSKRN